MGKSVKGTQTEKNLLTSFAGESQARMRYTYFASVAKKEEATVWQCRNCGFVHEGTEAPKACPACLHPQAYFEVKKTNY